MLSYDWKKRNGAGVLQGVCELFLKLTCKCKNQLHYLITSMFVLFQVTKCRFIVHLQCKPNYLKSHLKIWELSHDKSLDNKLCFRILLTHINVVNVFKELSGNILAAGLQCFSWHLIVGVPFSVHTVGISSTGSCMVDTGCCHYSHWLACSGHTYTYR